MKDNSIHLAGKRSAIYVRVSTEEQAQGASPEVQEADCRALSERHGYIVTKVYREVEKYRVRGRLVEPSGTRSDRPQWLRMLADYDAGKFDVVIAWRDDRLYRGVTTAVIALRDRAKQGLMVELVNGMFDPRTCEILAWAAGIENQSRVQRRSMGVADRFSKGRLWLSNSIYGYDLDKEAETLTVNETEADWVRAIWGWYAVGVSILEIRRRLIAADAPQSTTSKRPRKHKWGMSVIVSILHNDTYATGIFVHKHAKKVYEFTVPVIVDHATYQAAQERRAAWKAYPAARLQVSVLFAGRIYCEACGRKLGVVGIKRKNGKRIYYYCYGYRKGMSQPDCCKHVRQDHTDADVWRDIYEALTKPGLLEQSILEKAAALQSQEADQSKALAELERQLDDVLMERQKVITYARRGIISDDDLVTQLFPLTGHEKALRREIADRRLVTGSQAEALMGVIDLIRQEAQAGLGALAPDAPSSEKQFEGRRRIVEALGVTVKALADKSLKIDGIIPLRAPEIVSTNSMAW